MLQPLVADLLPWVVAFFLADGIVQLGRGHLLLSGSGGLRPLRAGLHWLGVSPLTEAVAVFDLPFLRTGDRVVVLDPRRRTEPALIEAIDLTAVDLAAAGALAREGKAVTAGGRRLLSAPNAATAERLRSLLVEGAGRPAGDPGADLAAARALRAGQRPYRLALQALASALLAGLVVMALAVWTPLAPRIPLAAVAQAFAAILVSTAAVGTALLRRSGEGWRASVTGGLEMLLPWAALHPLVHLSRTLYRRFDALTAAAALLPAEAFHRLAARELVRARLSRARTAPELAGAWMERERLLAFLLTATGSSEEKALAPPAAGEGAVAYCPLCRTGYRQGFDACADCGAPLEPLARG